MSGNKKRTPFKENQETLRDMEFPKDEAVHPTLASLIEIRNENEDLRFLLEHCNFEVPDDVDEAIRILKIAQDRRLKRWAKKCIELLQEKLTPGNVIPLLLFAADKDRPVTELKEACFKFMLYKFMEIYKLEDFKKLRLIDVKAILEHNELKADKEEDVLSAAAGWVRSDISTRKKVTDQLMIAVRLPLCELSFLSGLRDHFLLFDQPGFQADLQKTIDGLKSGSQEFKDQVGQLKRTPKP